MQKARRHLLIASSALFAPTAVFAQSKPKVARIGWVMSGNPAVGMGNVNAFRDGLRELGYVEGRDVVMDVRWAEGDLSRLPRMASELVRSEVDVIMTGGTPAGQAAKAATNVIPIVSAGSADIAESGLVASLAKPGGNVTGFAVAFPETGAKQLEIMREVVPAGRRVAVLWGGSADRGDAFYERQRKEIEARAPSQFEVTWHATNLRSELQPTFQAVLKSRPDFLLVLSTAFYFAYRKELARFAAETRTPAIYGFREYVDDGGLISYGASITESFRRAAGYVDRILKGAKPADLPVQMPSRLELAVNTKAARELGLRIPQSVLARADIIVKE